MNFYFNNAGAIQGSYNLALLMPTLSDYFDQISRRSKQRVRTVILRSIHVHSVIIKKSLFSQ